MRSTLSKSGVPKKVTRPENIPVQNAQSFGKEQLKPVNQVTNYSASFSTKFEALFYEEGDGEIFQFIDMHTQQPKIMTCIDIGTLYFEKRGNALSFIDLLCKLRHPSLVPVLNYYVIQNRLIYVEMESTPTPQMWKAYSKQPLSVAEIFNMLVVAASALEYIHQVGIVHRDVHPSRFHCFRSGVKFNPIGMPFNFKKLVKKSNFCGHINYSAPEMVMEVPFFDGKVDVWALGCCIYYWVNKKDLFDCGGDHRKVKQKILGAHIEKEKLDTIPKPLLPIFEACLQLNPAMRPSASQLLQLLQQTQVAPDSPTKSPSFQSPEWQHSSLFDISAKSEGAFLRPREMEYEKEEELLQKDEVANSVFASLFDNLKVTSLKESDLTGSTEEAQPESSVHFEQDGSVYEGEWKNNMKHGKGREVLNGNCYEGTFECGLYQGRGAMAYQNGNRFEGLWEQGERKSGVLTYANGDSYTGEFEKNHFHGTGTLKQGTRTITGQFVLGAASGPVTVLEDNLVYKGDYQGQTFHGQGELTDASTFSYKGQFSEGKRHGPGWWRDLVTLEEFSGTWERGQREGPGTLTNKKSGFVISGVWKNDVLVETLECKPLQH